jgi:photosystem II stability/assembly factor-like uncharacterized protein
MADQVTLLVGTNKGAFFYQSDKSGGDWKMSGPYMAGWEIYSLLAAPNNRAATPRLFAGTSSFVYGPTVRVSDDMGATWRQIEKGPSYGADAGWKLQQIWQIVPGHPSQPGTFYAGVADAGLFVSRDGGENWSEVDSLTKHPTRPKWFPGGGGLCLHTIVVDPTNPNRMWLGISAVGVFRTEDGGKSWTVRNQGLGQIATGDGPDSPVAHCVHKIVRDPARPDTLYMQYHGGVYRSTDGADNWTRIESGLPSNFGFPMAMTKKGDLFIAPLESDEKRMAKEGRLRVYRSRDRGDTWQEMKGGLPDQHYVGVLRDAMTTDSNDGLYFGTTSGELFASRDAGDSWQKLPGQLPRITCVKTWSSGA